MPAITHIVVHYSATYADQNLTVTDIDRMHRERGWKMVGYHYVVRRDGVVERGRPETMVGAHVGGQNTGKIGICWIGGLDRKGGSGEGVDNRTWRQTESLIRLINGLLERYPGAKVVGHRDLAATQCPGFDVPAWWAKVQDGDVPVIRPVDATAPTRTAHLGEEETHVVSKGETWWSIAQSYGLGVADLARANGASPADTLHAGRVLTLIIPARIRDKPVVPHSVEAEVERKAGWWQRVAGLAGSGGLGLGWLAGLDWRAILAGGAIVIAVMVIILLLRRQIVAAVEEIRGGLA